MSYQQNYPSAKYSPIGPISILEDLEDHELLGDYLLLLAHDVLDNRDRYRNLFGGISDEKQPHVIMDNSLVELGSSIDLSLLFDAADIVNADCIIIPDSMASKDGTMELWELHKTQILEWHTLNSECTLMKVVQGATVQSINECAMWWRDQNIPNSCWGVPRIIANMFGSRISTVQVLNKLTDEDIHLLGMSDDLEDDLRCTKLPQVVGIDSANPLVVGQKGIKLDYSLTSKEPIHLPRGDYWDDLQTTQATRSNIRFIRRQIERK